jgi:small subunit ribosomal protein S17
VTKKNEKEQQKIYKKRRKGIVIKIIDEKTTKVEVERKAPHPLYKKIIKTHKKYLVDTNSYKVKLRDEVMIEETNPISKRKKFKIIKVNTK